MNPFLSRIVWKRHITVNCTWTICSQGTQYKNAVWRIDHVIKPPWLDVGQASLRAHFHFNFFLASKIWGYHMIYLIILKIIFHITNLTFHLNSIIYRKRVITLQILGETYMRTGENLQTAITTSQMLLHLPHPNRCCIYSQSKWPVEKIKCTKL